MLQMEFGAFSRLSAWTVPLLFGPLTRHSGESDLCPITLVAHESIRHAVAASDKRVYDASALHEWSRVQRAHRTEAHVIPGCPLQWVSGTPWGVAHVMRACSYLYLACAHMLWQLARRRRSDAAAP